MNKNNLPLYFAIALVLGILIGVFFGGDAKDLFSFSEGNKQEQKIKKLINFIEKDYVDDVNTDDLLDGAITQMLGKLDPHSVYIPKENLQAVTESMQGNFVGIGVQFRMIKDSITVIQPIKGGPSIKAGIKAGDRILMANTDTLYGKGFRNGSVPKYLKGKPNTDVTLQVYRKSNDSLFNVDITRGKVNIKSVDLAYMINDSVGYIKLDRFARNTYSEFKTSLNMLKENGMTDLVLDLRGNGGGFIEIANRIIDEFLESDKLMVFTKDNKERIENFYATSMGSFEDGGLYVLIDENSASASEIVAGALQDNDKGTIIGRRSFGKGLVQIEMDLGDGSAVRLTTARYFTPTGRSIQKPYSGNGNKNYYKDYQQRILSGELLSKDSIKVVDSLQYKTPKGKLVYGGGGIIPDVFVAIDTTSMMTNFYFNTINNFAFDYVDENRKELNDWTIDTFVTEFDSNNEVYENYLASIKDKVTPSFRTEKTIKPYLKASIANVLFGDVGFYRIMHKDDQMLQKVLELESKKE
ncbi:S41 family peptidase [Polaribacter dokdonensis]|uniref:Carboxyl-terminal processing protease n=1 Tax=Polaribacter dokdonensis DSW-5 TaxID=1300348 RepID=A0A0N0UNG7_9FLAO|nr:S41 family peptidase [Polaribacter dokdonensis]KOY51590.1 Peptidase family S41 [Polaribacter dokdonensis DSW-5]SEE07888.1 carboxyl-terminal processing protease [Polaribacter dokdonensis DSW-5]